MSNAWRSAERERSGANRRAQVGGRDFARRLRNPANAHPVWAWFVAGLICGALLLVALRIDIIRLRYQVAHALEREAELRGIRREWVVAERRLRQPARLAQLAAERGFDRPTEVVRLEPRKSPTAHPEGDIRSVAARSLPGVASGPEDSP